MPELDRLFSSSIAQAYEAYLVPLLFRAYAEDLAKRVRVPNDGAVLEIAAGTGVLTRALTESLPKTVQITATDLNLPMLEVAAKLCDGPNVVWQQADALALPFREAVFDAVVCQFGVMFFPDKIAGFREMRRVLKPNCAIWFNTWDCLERNEIASEVRRGLSSLLGAESAAWAERVPFGYNDPKQVASDLKASGFIHIESEIVEKISRAPSVQEAALGFCLGSPLRSEIEERGAQTEQAIELAETALRKRFGAGPLEAKMRAHVFTAKTA